MWNEPPMQKRSLSLDEIKDLLAADSPPNDSSQDSILKQHSQNSLRSGSMTSVEMMSSEMIDKKSDTYPPKVKMLVPKPPVVVESPADQVSSLPPLPSLASETMPTAYESYDDDFEDGDTEEDESDLNSSGNSQDF